MIIPAKQAKEGTKVEEQIAELISELNLSIQMRMDLGYCYLKWDRDLPESVKTMLTELGYELKTTRGGIFDREILLIMWGFPKYDMGIT